MNSRNPSSADSFPKVHYPPGHSVATADRSSFALDSGKPVATKPPALPGDFILTHSNGVYGTLIRVGERLHYRGTDKKFAHWSHAAIFANGKGDIIEALGGGVQKRNISVYRDTEYTVVHLPLDTTDSDREQAVKIAEYCLRQPYGWLTILRRRGVSAVRLTCHVRYRSTTDMLRSGRPQRRTHR